MSRSMKLQRVRDPLYNLIEFREERVDDLLLTFALIPRN